MNKQIDRLRAEEELRQVQLLASVTSQEGYDKQIQHLQKQLGTIAVYDQEAKVMVMNKDGLDPEFDREGLKALKARHCVPHNR